MMFDPKLLLNQAQGLSYMSSASLCNFQPHWPCHSSLNMLHMFPPQGLCPFSPHHLEYSATHLHMAYSLTLSAVCSNFTSLELLFLTLLSFSSLLPFFLTLSPVAFIHMHIYICICIIYLPHSSKLHEGLLLLYLQDSAWQVSSRYSVNTHWWWMNELSGAIRAIFFFRGKGLFM